MDLQEKVTERLSGLEKLVAKLPGFKGYKARETRREADKLLRDQLVRLFTEVRERLSGLQLELLGSGQLALVDDLERAVGKLQLLIDRVKMARYGYAGFFDAIKVKEEQLNALYNFDNRLLEQIPALSSAVDKLAAAIPTREGVTERIREIIQLVADLNTQWSHREETILE